MSGAVDMMNISQKDRKIWRLRKVGLNMYGHPTYIAMHKVFSTNKSVQFVPFCALFYEGDFIWLIWLKLMFFSLRKKLGWTYIQRWTFENWQCPIYEAKKAYSSVGHERCLNCFCTLSFKYQDNLHAPMPEGAAKLDIIKISSL